MLRLASHELRTPLNSIIGFSEILNGELYGPLGSPRYRQYAGIIQDSGQRLLRLVNQILDLVRVEAGAADLDLQPQDLDAAIQDALASLKEAPGVQAVVIEGEPALPLVMADGRGLRTVLTALLDNALAFSPSPDGVRVRAVRRAGWVDIEVEDRAGGIPIEDIARVLRPFERGENAHVRPVPGAGLGLALARAMSEAMGGSFRLDSRPGDGLTAIVRLLPGPDDR